MPLYLKQTVLSFPWLLSPPPLVYSIGSPRVGDCVYGVWGTMCEKRTGGHQCPALSPLPYSFDDFSLNLEVGYRPTSNRNKPSEYITTPVLFCFSLTWVLGSKFRSSSFRSTCPQILSHLCSPHWRFPDMLLARLPSACTIAQPCWLLSLPLPNSCSMAFT